MRGFLLRDYPKTQTLQQQWFSQVRSRGQDNMVERIRGRKWMAIRSRILERDYGLCQECQRKGRITIGREVDHIKALINGGSNKDDNLECICADCHAKKTDADLGNKTRATIGADGWPKQEANESPVWMRKGYK